MCRILWANDKALLFLIIVEIFLDAVIPFINMRLIKQSIDMLTSGEEFSLYLPTVLVLLGLTLAAVILQALISLRSDTRVNMIGSILFGTIFNKTMELDYAMFQDKAILEKRELAMKVIDQQQFVYLTLNFRKFISNLIIVGGVVYIVSSIEWWILLIVIAIVIINSAATTKRKDAERATHTESIPVGRRSGYFESINSDFAYGKEIRTYNMQESLNSIHDKLLKTTRSFVKRIMGLNFQGAVIGRITTFFLNAVIYGYLGYKILVLRLITVGDFSLFRTVYPAPGSATASLS
jgi:ABC-type multidrug transport system fused ATPase/permease subunit